MTAKQRILSIRLMHHIEQNTSLAEELKISAKLVKQG